MPNTSKLAEAEALCHQAVSHVAIANYAEREREAHKAVSEVFAALAASKGTPDSMGHGQPLPSLSVDTSVAIPLDLARFLLGEADHRGRWFGEAYAGVPRYWWRTPLRSAIDAAMSADVRSQATEKP